MTLPLVVDPLLTQNQNYRYNFGNPAVLGLPSMQAAQGMNIFQNRLNAQNACQSAAQVQQQYQVVTDENGNRYAAVQTVEDGNDDGKISAWSKLKNFGKGCLKFVTGMFTDENGNFSIWQTTKTVAILTAATVVSIASAGTAAAPALAAAGVALGVCTGGYKVVKGAINAANAKTDAEAEAAWQDMGLGATTIGVSVTGAKAAMKSVNNGASYQGNCLQATKDCFVATYDNAMNFAKGLKSSYQAGTLMADAASVYNAAKTNIVTNSKAIFGSSKALSNFELNKIKEYDDKIAALDPVKDAEQIEKLYAQCRAQLNEVGRIEKATTTDEVANIVKAAKERLEALQAANASKAEIAAAKSQLNIIKTAGNIKSAQIKEAILSASKSAGSKSSELAVIADNALSTQSNPAVTVKEGIDLLHNAYVAPLKRAIIHQVKHNPILAMDRNVEENGTQVTSYYAIQ